MFTSEYKLNIYLEKIEKKIVTKAVNPLNVQKNDQKLRSSISNEKRATN